MFKTYSITEQVASHLRSELIKGRWTGLMPGRNRLVADLGVNGNTLERALKQLEQEGLLESQGAGKRRKIIAKKDPTTLLILLVLYEPEDKLNYYVNELRRRLLMDNYVITIAPRTLKELNHDKARVSNMIEKSSANAVIIQSAARPILEALSLSSTPIFALFGRMANLPIAGSGPCKLLALQKAIRYFCNKKKQLIVMLVREEHITPELGNMQLAYLKELKKHNLPCSTYNIPIWENSPKGLRSCLDRLFQISPPTVILIDDWMLYLAIQNYLVNNQGKAYRSVNCLCIDYHPSFHWCQPSIYHFHWEPLDIVKRTIEWVHNIANGKEDRKQQLFEAKFVKGGALPQDRNSSS